MSWTPAESELLQAIRDGRPLIDVRAPVEFAQGSIPGAVNLPVLDDADRAAVGTLYKQEGQEAAIALGRKLVSGDVLAARMEAWVGFLREHPDAWLFCFRGGLRSQSVGFALREVGVSVPVISGGYKRLRSLLMRSLEKSVAEESFVVISGFTGAGKTAYLKHLAARSFRVCDLEALANHRGSAFGKRLAAQPSQIDFENELAAALLRGTGPVLLEDESRMIGRITLPLSLYEKIISSPVYVLEKSLDARARHLIDEYLEDYDVTSAASAEQFELDVHANLAAIAKRLGGVEYREIASEVAASFLPRGAWQKRSCYIPWVERLLSRYYDPLYLKHLERIQDRIVARGSDEQLTQELLKHLDATLR